MRATVTGLTLALFAIAPSMAYGQAVFTYQGRLQHEGLATEGPMDFQFRLYTGEQNGQQVGSEVEVQDYPVEKGLFQVELDFGSMAFNGSPRWLQIAVRPAGTEVYTTLTPRQAITPAPYAIHAFNAPDGPESPWAQVTNGIAYDDADVGIGLTAPNARLHVSGDANSGLSANINDQLYVRSNGFVGINRDTSLGGAEVFGILADTNFDYGGMYMKTTAVEGQPFYGYASANSNMWTYYKGSTGKWHVNNNGNHLTVQSNGRIGIGTENPEEMLDVNGTASVNAVKFPDGSIQTTASSGGGSSQWTASGYNIYSANVGNVGVGDTTPTAKLDVSGTGTVVRGTNTSSNRFGYLGGSNHAVYGENPNWTYGLLGGSSFGVYGYRMGAANYGYLAGNTNGAYGRHGASQNFGMLGSADHGVRGRFEANDNEGKLGTVDHGVHGENPGDDTMGYLAGANGVYGENTADGHAGALGNSSYGAIGIHGDGSWGVLGSSMDGVLGFSNSATGAGGSFINLAGGLALRANGKAQVHILEIIGGSDLAEPFDVSSEKIKPEPGMVVSIDPNEVGKLTVCDKAYDRTVAGIISGAGGIQPGMIMSQTGTEADGSMPVALTGRVRVMCDARNGAIKPGDLLTTSELPGHAMKVGDYGLAQGAIIGKAMSSLAQGETGLVLVLVNLQ